ncbi:MAG: response regulator [Desulfonatronovibrionaceae bacterium]
MFTEKHAILVVDDVEPARHTVINILRVLGYQQTEEAATGQEAWEKLQAKPDVGLVISDWKMPGMSGVELLKKVREEDRLKDLPFFMVTSKSEKEDVAQAFDLGATGYMVKPLNIQVLKSKMESLFKETPARVLKKLLVQTQEKVQNGDFLKAKLLLLDFLKKNPDFKPRIFLELGLIMELEAKWDEAEKMADSALKMNPEMTRAWFLKARIRGVHADWEKAAQCIGKAIELNPRNADFLMFQGRVYLEMKNFPRARSSFITLLNAFPRDMELKQKIWNMYLDFGFVEQVQVDFGAILFESLSIDTLNNLAVALRKKDLLKESLLVYKQALKKEPNNSKVLYNAAMAQSKAGNPAVALKYLERAIDITPDFNEASELLATLRAKV